MSRELLAHIRSGSLRGANDPRLLKRLDQLQAERRCLILREAKLKSEEISRISNQVFRYLSYASALKQARPTRCLSPVGAETMLQVEQLRRALSFSTNCATMLDSVAGQVSKLKLRTAGLKTSLRETSVALACLDTRREHLQARIFQIRRLETVASENVESIDVEDYQAVKKALGI